MAEFDPKDFIKQYGEGGTAAAPAESDEPGTLRSFAGGAVQGALFDPVEGIGQLIEHATGHDIPIPQAVRDWFDSYKEKYTSGEASQYGRVAGTVGSLLIPAAGAARAAGWLGRTTAAQAGTKAVQAALAAPRTPGVISRFAKALPTEVRGTAIGAASGAAQPVEEGQDYAKTKLEQVASGALGGGIGASLAGPLTMPATLGGAGLIASQVHKSLGWPGVLALAGGLGALAGRHHMYGHGMGMLFDEAVIGGRNASRGVKKIATHPGGQYAAGRAGAAYGSDALEQIDDNQ